jgi:predicted ATPase/class 3 adenylate cyclase
VPELPSGTVTFLFTDIEGSTRLLQEHGERYGEALAEHRRTLRAAFGRHGGVEVDTQGDAFFFAFGSANEAAAAAEEAREALADGPIRVRIGIHTGEPQLTDEGYVGIDVHRAARICAAAHGGQVVLSESARSLVEGSFTLTDLGLHRLKDLGEPERMFQLGEGTFPPLRSLNVTNLPAQPSSLVGRERELEEVKALVRERRLITLTGAGGSGKTRLGLQVAAELAHEFTDGVFWVPLASLTDSELVLPMIAATVGARERLPEHIGEKRMLLLLDNLEQVVDCAPALGELLETCPNLTLLATSRAALRLAGEREYEVAPLPDHDAVTLFRERALQAEPREAVEKICRRLDGLPLAIELAAAQTRVLPPPQLLDRLERRLPLLTRGRRDAPERQRTLKATIEWSYELLSQEDTQLFSRLAVFAGSFDLEAAEQVCEADLDGLESLLEQSLLRRTEGGRFFYLETIREFALERLDSSGEALHLQHLHAQHYLALAEREWPELRGPGQAAALRRLESEHSNLRAAIAWACAQGSAELALRLAAFLWRFWWVRGLLSEGRRWLSEVLALPVEGLEAVRATVLEGAAALAWGQADAESAEVHAEGALDLFRRIDDKRGVARALNHLGLVSQERGSYERARGFFEESGTLARELGNERGYAVAVVNLGGLALIEGDYARARELSELGLRLHREQDSRDGEAISLLNLGFAALEEGATDEARKQLEDSCERFLELGFTEYLAFCVEGLAGVAAVSGAPEEAARLLGRAEALREEADASLGPFERRLHERTLAAVHEHLDDVALAEAWREGRAEADQAATAATP